MDSRSWRAGTGDCLNGSKQVFHSFLLLVDNKLKNIVGIYTQPYVRNWK